MNELTAATFGLVGGIWSSFIAAYFPSLESVLSRWRKCLVPGGWLALVEVDDLLGQAPLPADITKQVRAFYEESRKAGRYDFECGHRLAHSVKRAGLRVVTEQVLRDDELSFEGPAQAEVLIASGTGVRRCSALPRTRRHPRASCPSRKLAQEIDVPNPLSAPIDRGGAIGSSALIPLSLGVALVGN